MNFNFSVRMEGDKVLVAPQGRIDQATAASFQAALAPHLTACSGDTQTLVLDFAGVSYISSVGLRVLMLASRQVAAQKGRLLIAAPTPLVREVFEISRFNLVFPIFDSVAAALAPETY